MPKNQNKSVSCRYFAWRLFRRDGVYYADGRGGKHDLGKHSLGTRDREKALETLHQLDEAKAVEIGFEHGRLHSFRHFFCSQCFLGGASEGEIKEWLGHADSKMVEHYRHLRSEDAQRKMNQIQFLERVDGRPDMNCEPASGTASGNQEETCATNMETSKTSGRSTAGINPC